jgi:hypothetical protein
MVVLVDFHVLAHYRALKTREWDVFLVYVIVHSLVERDTHVLSCMRGKIEHEVAAYFWRRTRVMGILEPR